MLKAWRKAGGAPASEDRATGFTLIELLVVIIIIGILAAVAIPIYLHQRNKGYDAAVESDLHNFANAEEAYFTDNDHYTTSTTALDSPAVNLSYSPRSDYFGGIAQITVALLYTDAQPPAVTTDDTQAMGGYCLQATAASGDAFHYDSTKGGLASGSC